MRSEDPLFGAIPDRIPLEAAPLVRVLGQVRFPKIAKISDESYIADFQEAIRRSYPVFKSDTLEGVELNITGGTLQHRASRAIVWRFFDADETHRITLTTDAITLESAQYVSRESFIDRMRFLLGALGDNIDQSHVLRVGFRYVDRLQGADFEELPSLIRPELLNVLQPNLLKHIDVSMSEVVTKTLEGQMIVRYGKAPPNFTHDPDLAPPVSEDSWVLDVDSFSTTFKRTEFDPEMICLELDKVAARAYAFFRWSVTDSFIERFKGG